ncbi:uncharacterized protein AB675_11813 [Cyphellophora attinorum]|uniref:Uncharacterized protein n=1 Tax=Cyphellophora attinorum TaxID=1664694 RepID=A0A0N1HP05_9EURO|nr:uncharacterized protein AB675_11813 [Phialophora attinorum]KPI36887.1 hypothetical protein AB675_11813 [Phialophora attinorum]
MGTRSLRSTSTYGSTNYGTIRDSLQPCAKLATVLDSAHPLSEYTDTLTTIQILADDSLPDLIQRTIKHVEKIAEQLIPGEDDEATLLDDHDAEDEAFRPTAILRLALTHLHTNANIAASSIEHMTSDSKETAERKLAALKREVAMWAEIEVRLGRIRKDWETFQVMANTRSGNGGLLDDGSRELDERTILWWKQVVVSQVVRACWCRMTEDGEQGLPEVQALSPGSSEETIGKAI